MSENYRNYDEYGRSYDGYGRRHDNCRHDHKEKKSENCECKCVETLAHGLKEFKCKYIIAFEKNAFIVGRVKAVINNSVLVLEDGFKYVDDLGYFPFERIFISICKITEFIPLQNGTADTILNNLKDTGKTQVL